VPEEQALLEQPEQLSGSPRRARRARLTPQPHDGWTFVVVPPGANSRARTLRLSIRRLRAVAAAFAASAAVTVASGVVLVLLVATLPPLTAQKAGVELGVLSAGAAPDSTTPAVPAVAAVAPLSVEETADKEFETTRPAASRRRPVERVASPAADLADMSGMPVLGRITSRFSVARRHPMLGVVRRHNGIDIAAPTGTPITAPRAGIVHFVGRRIGYGIVVELDHGNGVMSRYAHCKSASVVEGERVVAGQQIATVGATGLATGPHLHYEVLVGGRNVNPLTKPLDSFFAAAALSEGEGRGLLADTDARDGSPGDSTAVMDDGGTAGAASSARRESDGTEDDSAR
jgi:murein DD-endopeptidase MepM/ murein hydrolase activator NlpD